MADVKHDTRIETVDLFDTPGRIFVAKCICGWQGLQRAVRQWAIQDSNNHTIAMAVKKGAGKS